MKIKELYTDESKWTQTVFARDAEGNPCPFNSDKAVSWCLVAAVIKCYPAQESLAIIKKIKDKIGGFYVGLWSDNYRRRFSDIQNLVTELDI